LVKRIKRKCNHR